MVGAEAAPMRQTTCRTVTTNGVTRRLHFEWVHKNCRSGGVILSGFLTFVNFRNCKIVTRKFCVPLTSALCRLPNSARALTFFSSNIFKANLTFCCCRLLGCSEVNVQLGVSFTTASCSLSYV